MAPNEARTEYPAEPASAGWARRFVAGTLEAWHSEELSEIATLLVSELVSNAILHAGTTIGVAVKAAGPRVRVEVHDESLLGANRKHYSSTSTTGRGLLLVEELSSDWGVATDAAGKTVWFELTRPEGRQRPAGAGVTAAPSRP